MGEKAKKQRAAVVNAAKKAKVAKAAQPPPASTDTTDPTLCDVNIATWSNAANLKKTAPPSVPIHKSAHSLGQVASSASSSAMDSGTSGNTDNKKSCPQHSATAAALALLQELQVSDTEGASEHDPEGVFTGNDEVDKIMDLNEDEDEDGGTDDSDENSDGSGVVVVEELLVMAWKGLPKAKKKLNLQVIDEDWDSSGDGEYFYLFSYAGYSSWGHCIDRCLLYDLWDQQQSTRSPEKYSTTIVHLLWHSKGGLYTPP